MDIWIWTAFLAFVFMLLALDLGVFHRRDHVISIREALAWSTLWIALAMAFNVFVYYLYENRWLGFNGGDLSGKQAALEFFTGYLVEKSLSVDNIFVIAMIFAYLGVPLIYQHRVLFWGILGALVLRGAMIGVGAALIDRFQWIVYVFGGLLLVTAVKLLITRHDNLEPDKNPLVKWARKIMPVTEEFDGPRFITRVDGARAMTPLGVALIVVESSDVLFAVDSIPAIFAITRDPFLVFTSNVFAILGLRSLYFALAGMIERFRYLKQSLVFLLAFIGSKMIVSHHYPIPTGLSLSIILGILGVGIAASVVASHRDTAQLGSPLENELEQLARVGLREAKRVVVVLGGSSVLLVGLVMIVLPGPALVVIPLGLGILAIEFRWARRWLARLRRTARKVERRMRSREESQIGADRQPSRNERSD